MQPLEGLTVVALEQAVAAPLCTRHLADLGARVIKIERPGVGDFARHYDTRVGGLASYFAWTNRSKESLTLDLKHPRGVELLAALVARADVLVQNLAPGAAARLGMGFEALHARHPGLIVCDISGYGDDPQRPGPYRDKKAYDLLIQAEAGFLSVTGTQEQPVKAGCSISDVAAGMYAYSAVLAALIERGRSGRGQRIDVSMLESTVEWMSHALYYAYDGAAPPPRAGAEHASIYPYGPITAGDGKVVFLGIQNEREWAAFCTQVLQQPALAQDPRFDTNAKRSQQRAALRTLITQAFAAWTADEVVARLERARIANARMNGMHEVWQHAQLSARERWTEVASPAGPVRALLPPGLAADAGPRMGAIPALGEHTDAILAELGCSAAEVAALRDAQIV